MANFKIIILIIIIGIFCKVNTFALDNEFRVESTSILEENEDISWSSIYNISVSPNQKYFAVSSFENNKYIGLYNFDNFKLNKAFFATKSLSDSLCNKVKCFVKDYKVLPNKYLQTNDLLSNYFRYSEFISDSILAINSGIDYYSIPEFENFDYPFTKNKICEAVIIKQNIFNKDKNITIFEHSQLPNTMLSFAQIYNFAFDSISHIFYTNTSDRYNSISVGAYDLNGSFIKSAHTFPEEMLKAKLYRITYNPAMALNKDNELILAYPYLPKIYNANKNTNFTMQNLEYDNLEFISKFGNDSLFFKQKKDSVFSYLRFRIKNIFIDKKDRIRINYSIFVDKGDERIVTPYLRIYEQNGNLIEEKKLDYKNENGKLNYVFYNKYDDYYYLFRKGDEKWTVEKCKWDVK